MKANLTLFLELLFLLFLGLKLGNVINWPWIAVFAPLWIPFAAAGITFLLILICVIIKMTWTGTSPFKKKDE